MRWVTSPVHGSPNLVDHGQMYLALSVFSGGNKSISRTSHSTDVVRPRRRISYSPRASLIRTDCGVHESHIQTKDPKEFRKVSRVYPWDVDSWLAESKADAVA